MNTVLQHVLLFAVIFLFIFLMAVHDNDLFLLTEAGSRRSVHVVQQKTRMTRPLPLEENLRNLTTAVLSDRGFRFVEPANAKKVRLCPTCFVVKTPLVCFYRCHCSMLRLNPFRFFTFVYTFRPNKATLSSYSSFTHL